MKNYLLPIFVGAALASNVFAVSEDVCATSCSDDCGKITAAMKVVVEQHEAACGETAPPQNLGDGCVNGSKAEAFSKHMVGCGGKVKFGDRASLCEPGFKVCSATEWVAYHGGKEPVQHYWTDDLLKYTGEKSGECSVSRYEGNSCANADEPMRVCTSKKADGAGNECQWSGCGLETQTNQYFGGCYNNPTAGTLCCKI